jgi:hypothetical protein
MSITNIKDGFGCECDELEKAVLNDDTKGVYSRQIALLLLKVGGIDRVVSESSEIIRQHDSKIAMLEKFSEKTTVNIEFMRTVIDEFIAKHSDDGSKIVMWVAGILAAQTLAIIGAVFGIVKLFGGE